MGAGDRQPRRHRRRNRLVALLSLTALVTILWTQLASATEPYEIYEAAVSTSGPTHQYRFSESSGAGEIIDSAGTCTITGNTGLGSINLGNAGPFAGSKAGKFAGIAYGPLPCDPLQEDSAFTAEGWVDWTGSLTNEPIFEFGSGTSKYMVLTPSSSATKHPLQLEIHTSSATNTVAGTKALPTGTWEYVAVTETTGGTLALYLNGEEVGKHTGATLSPASLGSSVPDDYIGNTEAPVESRLHGSLSNLAFYNKALSAEEIKTHYTDGELPGNTEAPTITGTDAEGSMLKAAPGTWTGATPQTYTYVWQRCIESVCSEAGTGSEYKLSELDVATTIRVVVTAKNSAGTGPAPAVSSPTAEIEGKPHNTSAPTISGEAKVGRTLTLSEGSWRAFPEATFGYQWQSCEGTCANITEGANAAAYVAKQADLGKKLRASVTGTNSFGATVATTAQTSAVVAGSPLNTAPPVLSSEVHVGATLTASTGTWVGNTPFTYSYEWLRCTAPGSCSTISSATTSSYTLKSEDAGKTIVVAVTAENGVSPAATAESSPSATVPGAPVNTVLPSISGTAEDTQTLAVSTGTWTGSEPITYSYQWERCNGDETECTNIPGAKEVEYTLGDEDVGTTTQVAVTATNSAGSASVLSEGGPVVQPAPPSNTEPPTISGFARTGRTLTANAGNWVGFEDLSFGYQWEQCNALGEACLAIPGATEQELTLTSAEVDTTIRVTVTGTAIDYASAVASSSVTETVQPGPVFSLQFGSPGTETGQFGHAAGVALDGEDVLVLDSSRDQVDVFNRAGEYLSAFGSEGSEPGQLKHPDALAVDAGGNVFVLDTGNGRVEQFEASGTYVGQFPVEGSNEGIAIDREGRVWVSQTSAGRLDVFSASGETLGVFGEPGTGETQLGEPEGIAVTESGEVLVADWRNRRVEGFNESGEYVRTIGEPGELSRPYGVAVDPEGDIFVADSGKNRVSAFTPAGEPSVTLGVEETPPGRLSLSATPVGVAADSGGIWATDSGHGRIVNWTQVPSVPSNSTAPSIGGEAVAGRPLTAGVGSWLGSPSRYEYQWRLCDASGESCADIEGASSESFTVPAVDVGKTLRVFVTAVNGGGSTSAVSAASSVIAAASAPVNTTAPAITGPAQDGIRLAAGPGVWSGTPASYAYQWEACNSSGEACHGIEGATDSEYALTDGDVGTRIRVLVTATNAAGSAESTSSPTAAIAAEPPSELRPPVVSGTAGVHQVLQADHGAWYGTGTLYAYQWERCNSEGAECEAVPEADESEYDLQEADEGKTLRVRVGVGSVAGSLSDVSQATPPVGAAGALADSSPPTISGTPQSGQTLTAASGSWSGHGTVSFAYQWQSCNSFGGSCEAISGATSATFTPGSGQLGQTLRVAVTATDLEGTQTRGSEPTQPIAAVEAPVSAATPSIEGTPLEGASLTVSGDETWTGGGSLSYSRQWQRCTSVGACTAISGATEAFYTPGTSDVGKRLRVLTTATGTSGSTVEISSATPAIEPQSLVQLAPASLTGLAQPEGVLVANPGIWRGAGEVSYGYQWQRCSSAGTECGDVSGATEADYVPSSGDVGSTLKAKVTATNSLGTGETVSELSPTVAGGLVTPEQALEIADETDPALLSPANSAMLEGHTIAPTLIDGEQLTSEHALTTSTFSKETPGEVSVNTADGSLSLDPVETSHDAAETPTLVNSVAGLTANLYNGADLIARPEPTGATMVLQSRSAEAPRRISWEVRLGADQELRQLSDGSVAVVSAPEPEESTAPSDPETGETGEGGEPETSAEKAQAEEEEAESETFVSLPSLPTAPVESATTGSAPTGEPSPQDTAAQFESAQAAIGAAEAKYGTGALMAIETPKAVDAAGHTVPATLTTSGDTVTVTLSPEAGVTYPILTEVSIAAPTDKVSEERDPVYYGLADNVPTSLKNLDPKLVEGPLHIKYARLSIAWDAVDKNDVRELTRLKEWLAGVEQHDLKPYVTIYKSPVRSHYPGVGEYRAAVRALMKRFGSRVPFWGSWNEPDLTSTYAPPGRAAEYWEAAESAALEVHCKCGVVAGEFAIYDSSAPYPTKYRAAIKANAFCAKCWNHKRDQWLKHRLPTIWGVHDYHDVVAQDNSATDAKGFAGFTGARLGNPQLWIGEAGSQLFGSAGKTILSEGSELARYERQTAAAKAFLKLGEAKGPGEHLSRYKRVYYYNYLAPSEKVVAEKESKKESEFDSALMEAAPEVPEGKGKSYGLERPAYCVLLYEDHECPPVITESGQDANRGPVLDVKVATHGLQTTVVFHFEKEGASPSTQTKIIRQGYLRPFKLNASIFSCSGRVKMWAVAKNAGGEAETATVTSDLECE